MQIAKLTAVQAAIIVNARSHSSKDERQQIKREVFANAKARYGIPQSTRVSCNVTGEGDKGYLILTLGGKRNKGVSNKQAFQLGDDGKFTGMVPWSALFPPPAPAAVADAAAPAASIFGSTAPARWFRLDPSAVAGALTAGADSFQADGLLPCGDGGDLPTPHLMLAGRTDLAITADGSIYRSK